MFNKLKSTLTAPMTWFHKITNHMDASQKLHRAFGNDKLYHFHGGKHLELGKHLTNTGKVYRFPEVDYYLLNMQQHKGPKAIATVTEGDVVDAGQPLTSMLIKGELPIHSPVNGTVAAVTEYLVASMMNKTGPTIVIQNNNHHTANLEPREITDFSESEGAIGPSFFEPMDYYYNETIDSLRRIKYAGIAGMGGAVFPSARKINNREFITLLVNACECEPYITCDDLLMQKYSTTLVEAFICAQHILKCEQIIVAIEDDKPKAIANLKGAIADKISSLKAILSQIPDFPVEQYCSDILTSAKNLDFYREKENSDFKPKPFQGEQATARAELTKPATTPEEAELKEELKEQSIELPHEPPYRSAVLSKYRHYFEDSNNKVGHYLRAARALHALLCIKVRVIPTVYPSGNQRTTIEVLTGMRLTKKQNLTSMGAICFNVMTVYSIYRAITYGEVLTQRLVTLTGEGIAKPGNYWLPFGLTPAVLLDTIGASSTFTGKVIMGGPMMGFELDDLNVPINKATNCLLFIGEAERQAEPKLFGDLEEQSCIRCQACQRACPVNLQPQMMYWYERDKNDDKLNKAHLSSCVECGLCDYVCPSNIPLVSYFQSGKHRIFQKREKERIAAESKIRFEVKSKRDAELKAIEEAKRAESKRKRDERAAAMQAAAQAAGGVNPVTLAQIKLQAKGVRTGETIAVPPSATSTTVTAAASTSEQAGTGSINTAGSNSASTTTPDNSAIMEQRRLRREAKRREQQEQAQQVEQASASAKSIANNAVKLEATPSSTTDRQAQIAAAIARAKSKAKSIAPPEVTPPSKAPEIDPLDVDLTDKKMQVTAAIARAKAKAEQSRLESQNKGVSQITPNQTASDQGINTTAINSNSGSTFKSASAHPKSAILDAVAKAKAKQQAFLAEQQKLEQEQLQQAKLEQDTLVQEKEAKTIADLTIESTDNTTLDATVRSTTENTSLDAGLLKRQDQVMQPHTPEFNRSEALAAVERAKQAQSAHTPSHTTDGSSNNGTSSATVSKISTDKKSAILAAVNRAKALQAQARQAQAQKEELVAKASQEVARKEKAHILASDTIIKANSSNENVKVNDLNQVSSSLHKDNEVTNDSIKSINNSNGSVVTFVNINGTEIAEANEMYSQQAHPSVTPYGPEDAPVTPISNFKVQTTDFNVPAEAVVEMEIDMEESEDKTAQATKMSRNPIDKRAAVMAAVAKAKAARALQVQDFLERLDAETDNNSDNK